MILTPHILVGATLGANITNPLTVAASAMALHFALDAIPHWDYDIYGSKIKTIFKVGIDLAIAWTAVIFLTRHLPPGQQINALIGGFFGVLPDGLLVLSFIFKNKYLVRYAEFHNFWHWLLVRKGYKSPLIWGVGAQAAIVCAVFLLRGF